MKTIVITFIIGALSKGILLFLVILFGDYTPNHILLYFLVYFLVFGFADWVILNSIKSELHKINWLKLIPLTFGTFVMVLWITGPLFQFYNWMYSIPSNPDVNLSVNSITYFLVIGFVISATSTAIWVQMNKKESAININN